MIEKKNLENKNLIFNFNLGSGMVNFCLIMKKLFLNSITICVLTILTIGQANAYIYIAFFASRKVTLKEPFGCKDDDSWCVGSTSVKPADQDSEIDILNKTLKVSVDYLTYKENIDRLLIDGKMKISESMIDPMLLKLDYNIDDRYKIVSGEYEYSIENGRFNAIVNLELVTE
jgi:hypothetical protein